MDFKYLMSFPYKAWRYLYPPRPKYILTYDRIPYYEGKGWVAQYKKNGTCTVVGVSPEGKFHAMNRHAQQHKAWHMTPHIKKELLKRLPKGVWTVLIGEILHSKTKEIKDTIYFHDVLVHNSEYLIGSTFMERQQILETLLPGGKDKGSYWELDKKLWRAKLITKNILDHFHNIEKIRVDEGVVLKNPTGKLRLCNKEDNNLDWQFKVRYAAKNYQF